MKLTPHLMPFQLDAKNVDAAETEGPPFELPEDTWSERAEVPEDAAVREERAETREQNTELREDRGREERRSDSEERQERPQRDLRHEEREREDAPVFFAQQRIREEKRPVRPGRQIERQDMGLLLNRDLEPRRVLNRGAETIREERAHIQRGSEETTPQLVTRRESQAAREANKPAERVTPEPAERGPERRSGEERIAGSRLETVERAPREAVPKTVETRPTAMDRLAQIRASANSKARGKDISIARDLLQNVREARLDETRAADRLVRAANRGEAVRTTVTESVVKEVHNVFKKASDKRSQALESARDSHRMAEQGDESAREDVAVTSTSAAQTTPAQTPVIATQSVTAVSATASANAMNPSSTMGLDPEVSEALRNVRIEDPGDTVLRLNETEAGKLEVRIRANGDDLMVLVKAEEQALRQKMLDGLPDVRKALDRAELVAGRVDVAEYGAFENETRGESDQQGLFDSAFEDSLDQQSSEDGEPRQDSANPSNSDSTSPERAAASTPSSRTEDGRLHVIV